jgi:hypothetical protein
LQEEFEDTKGVIRIRKLKDRQHNGQKKKDRQHNGQKKKDRQHNGQKKKDRQHNGQKKKDKKTNNYLQNTTQKTIDRSTRTTQKPGVNPGAPQGKVVLAPLVEPVVVLWLQTR